MNNNKPSSPFKKKLYEIIFEADTRAGKWFDIILLVAILISVATVMLESVESIRLVYGDLFTIIEWIFTILFTIEYIARIVAIGKPKSNRTPPFELKTAVGELVAALSSNHLCTVKSKIQAAI